MSAIFLQNKIKLARPTARSYSQSQLDAFSLLEFMLASVMGLLLLVMLSQTYISLKKVYLLHQSLQILQENGRFASFYLRQQIAMAGYLPCMENPIPVQQGIFLHGYTKNSAPQYLTQSTLVANSDIVEIKQCAVINNISQLSDSTFYVANTARLDNHGKKITALYEKIKSLHSRETRTMELVPEVTRMKINYGIANAAGDIDTYVAADHAATINWQQVQAVHIALWLNSDTDTLQKEWDIYIQLKEKALS